MLKILERKTHFFLKILYLQLEQRSINFVFGFEEKNCEKKKYTNKGCVFTPFDI